jgi:polar amino acid transport system substrate-binding protein
MLLVLYQHTAPGAMRAALRQKLRALDASEAGHRVVYWNAAYPVPKPIRELRVDAIVLDNTISGAMTDQNPRLRVAREFDTGEQYGMAVRKDGNIPLLRKVNDALSELREDGTYDEIYSAYF